MRNTMKNIKNINLTLVLFWLLIYLPADTASICPKKQNKNGGPRFVFGGPLKKTLTEVGRAGL
jgi:hypothetical protein